jgi:membrane protein implicated in regulation of membrane protease activity
MSLILMLTFVVLVVIGQAINVAIAMQIDRYSEGASLLVFFVLLVVAIVVAWKLALRLTEPKDDREQTKENVRRAA